MTLLELKNRVDFALTQQGGESLEVCIPNNTNGMGGTPVTNVKAAHRGIDWDSNKFFIIPFKEMINQK